MNTPPVITPFTSAAGERQFSLVIDGQTRTYAHDKEGKRQAILDCLNALPLTRVGDDEYLPGGPALEAVAAVLYPAGIQHDGDYQTAVKVTDKACAHLGFGPEEALAPPVVVFSARGSYRKRFPPVSPQLILDDLALAGANSTYPRQEMTGFALWNKAGFDTYGRHWRTLTPEEQALIRTQVDEIVTQAGWQQADEKYTKPLPIDEAAARRRLLQLLAQENGRPVLVSSVIYQAQLGAYGRSFYSAELPPALQTVVTETLQAGGYCSTLEDGEYRPLPVALAPETEADMTEKLAAITPVLTEFGSGLLLRDVLAAVVGQDRAISEWQAEALIQNGRVGQALRQLGYQTGLTWCQPYHFQPKYQGHDARQVILKEVRVKNDPAQKLSLAQGLAVLTPALTIDDVDDTLVYLQMIGAKQAVKANWAALMGSGKVHWLGRKRVCLDGMKAHVKIQATLPCGWTDHILIHKQASLKEMNPERPFYLLDDGKQPIPSLFYPMLNKCLALPLLPEWAGYLWENGREHNLVTLLDEGEGQGYAAWRVLPSPKEWQVVVESGLGNKQVCF